MLPILDNPDEALENQRYPFHGVQRSENQRIVQCKAAALAFWVLFLSSDVARLKCPAAHPQHTPNK